MKSNMHNLICTSASSHGDQLSAELNWPGSDQRKRNSNASLAHPGHQFPTTYGSICMQNRNVGYDLCYIYSFFFLYIFIIFARSGLTIRSTSMDLMFYGDDWNTENYKSMYC